MKKLFYLFVLAAIVMGCSKEEMMPSTGEYTLTGYSAVQTKTDFGTPGSISIPFVWSVGDKIWSGAAQSSAANINPDGSASFSFATEPTGYVYYNMTGSVATTAVVPAQQDASKTLGENGDFGYAPVSNGSFTLQHATAYLWFYVTSDISNATLQWIEIDASDTDIAGSAQFSNSTFESISNGSSTVKLAVNQALSQSNSNVWAMVVLPADLSGKTIKVTYKLTVGGYVKYFTQELEGKNIVAGITQKISTNIRASELKDYILRVLTFEDEYWADIIPAEDEQAFGASSLIYGPNGYEGLDSPYEWYDANTQLAHCFPENYGIYNFAGGGYVISKHQGTMEQLRSAGDQYEYQLSIPLANGHNGSENFCIGYHDSWLDKTDDVKPALYFQDGTPRIIDHMYITNASITMYCMLYGNSFSTAFGENDFLRIVATGYTNGEKGSTVSYTLAEGADMKVSDWVKWDLSGLGKVDKVVFHMEEYQVDDYGYAKYTRTPMYFAFDDVAVRFEE